jgi:hypothetical protein
MFKIGCIELYQIPKISTCNWTLFLNVAVMKICLWVFHEPPVYRLVILRTATNRNPFGWLFLISVVRLLRVVILVVSELFVSEVKFSKICGFAIGSLYVYSAEKKHPRPLTQAVDRMRAALGSRSWFMLNM